MSPEIRQFDVVRVKAIRDNRFAGATTYYERLPQLDDVGAVLEVYSKRNLRTKSNAQTQTMGSLYGWTPCIQMKLSWSRRDSLGKTMPGNSVNRTFASPRAAAACYAQR